MTDPQCVKLLSPAKVNLALSVASPLPDDPRQMHPIVSLMVPLSFGDHLQLTRAADSRFNFQFAPHCQNVNQVVDWPLEKDLAYRAHQLLQSHTGCPLPVHARLVKEIPTGAGLGGGSSNAAAMFIALNRLYDLKLSTEQLIPLAMQLGSDVAFGIHAITHNAGAIVRGLGDQIQSVTLSKVLHMVLIFPPFGCNTAKVYHAFDQQHASPHPSAQTDEQAVLRLLEPDAITQDAPFNDLAQPACQVQPRLGALQQQLHQTLNLPVHITGSGSTLFVLAPNALTCQAIQRKITNICKLPAIATRTLG